MEQEQVKELLEQMTLEEKVAQMMQLTGFLFEGSGAVTGPDSEMNFKESIIRNVGSILNVTGAKTLHQVQERYLEKSSRKIPMIFMGDVINGFKTVFPIPLAQGCSFDMDLVKEAAAISARESAASGLHVTFSPMVDLVRDARWGRVMESTGEDVWLNSRMAEAMITGYQGDSLKDKGTVAACVKHFAAYGAPEGGRDYNSVDMSEKKLREEYLPAYRVAVDAGTALVMTSFNTVNGIPASANRWLMQDVLRDEWGFDGVLISDYSAIHELIPHGVAANDEEAASLGIRAGVDIDMVSPAYGENLVRLVEEGRVPEELVNRCTLRVLELKNKLGLLDNPYRFSQEEMEEEQKCIGCESHRQAARKLASESMVLLKNNGALPIKKGQRIALIGPYGDRQELCGSWSMFYDKEDVITIRQGLEDRFGAENVTTVMGSHILDKGKPFLSFGRQWVENDLEQRGLDEEVLLAEAVQAARAADVVVLALGEHEQQTGEGGARTDITLPKCQLRLLDAVSKVNPNTAVLLFNGRPLAIPEIEEQANAILEVWLPGIEGGSAVADILSGQTAPSGKLSMSFPYCTGQAPIHYSHLRTGRPLIEGELNRFTSSYLDAPVEPLYPFGYGLSYTEFSYGDFSADTNSFAPGGMAVITGKVKNTGSCKGTEVVQCYVQDVTGSTARPVKELKGVVRIELEPGEVKTFRFEVAEESLRFYRADGSYGSESGNFKIYVGGSSRAEEVLEISLP